jgi:hypothetical protein
MTGIHEITPFGLFSCISRVSFTRDLLAKKGVLKVINAERFLNAREACSEWLYPAVTTAGIDAPTMRKAAAFTNRLALCFSAQLAFGARFFRQETIGDIRKRCAAQCDIT